MLQNTQTIKKFVINKRDALPSLPQNILKLQRICAYESIQQATNVIKQEARDLVAEYSLDLESFDTNLQDIRLKQENNLLNEDYLLIDE